MKVGKPFHLSNVSNGGDLFIPLETKCSGCKRRYKLALPSEYAFLFMGSRGTYCSTCGDVEIVKRWMVTQSYAMKPRVHHMVDIIIPK
jgi:hypothetical protein